MVSFALLRVCLLFLTPTAGGLQPSDHLMMFALVGDRITLPCGIPSIQSCSSINWSKKDRFATTIEVVKAGETTPPNNSKLRLQRDCSLEINSLVIDDARDYICDNGALNSTVALRIPEVKEEKLPARGKIQLQCYLNVFTGYVCEKNGIRIVWSAKHSAEIARDSSECLSKMNITTKPTDHHRKWKCQVFQNDTLKATLSYTTTVEDGIEEVFAAVNESVSLSCGNTSSLSVGGAIKWAMGERTLSDDMPPHRGRTGTYYKDEDWSSLVISRVSPQHAGDYKCSESSTSPPNVFNRVRLHTLGVTSEQEPGGENVTVICVLTCATDCDKNFNLTWSGRSTNSRRSSLKTENNTLVSRLVLPRVPAPSDDLTCSVRKDGDAMASKKWHTGNSVQTIAWLALPLGVLACVAAGGLYMYMRRKHNNHAGVECGKGNEHSSVEMAHVYEDIQDENNEELHQQAKTNGEAATTTDSFYSLLEDVTKS